MGECLISRRGGGGSGVTINHSVAPNSDKTLTIPEEFDRYGTIYLTSPYVDSTGGRQIRDLVLVDGQIYCIGLSCSENSSYAISAEGVFSIRRGNVNESSAPYKIDNYVSYDPETGVITPTNAVISNKKYTTYFYMAYVCAGTAK